MSQSSFLTRDDVKIHYLTWEPVKTWNSLTLLLIHGTNQTCHTWDDFIMTISDQGFKIIAYDQRGHGDTSWCDDENDYSLPILTSDLEILVEHLSLDLTKTILIGMSLGGLVTLNYLSKKSNLLLGAVIVDITPHVTWNSMQDVKKSVTQSHFLDSFDDFVKWAKMVNPTRSEDNLRERLKWSLMEKDGKWTWKHDPRFVTVIRDVDTQQLWEKMKMISCPTLCIRGSESKITTVEQMQRMVDVLHNGSWVEIEKAGHSVQGDNPEGMKKAFLTWYHINILEKSSKM